MSIFKDFLRGEKNHQGIFHAVVLLALLPWILYSLRTGLNGDTSWLLIAARRCLDGQSMSGSYYENNPPFSILFHIPPVLFPWSGLFIHYAFCGYIFALMGLSAAAVQRILGQFPFLDALERRTATAAFLAGGGILASISFGEREQVIFLFLVPFMLVQLARTSRYPLPPALFHVCALAGSIMLLLKPHYFVLPGILQLHRAIAQKRFLALFDAESFYIAGSLAAYVLAVLFFFPDYAQIILPQVLKLYITNTMPAVVLPQLFLYGAMTAIFLATEAALLPLEGKKKKFLLSFYVASLICLIPYAIQMKGFYYHMLPAMGFFFIAFCLSALCYVRAYIKLDNNAFRQAVFILAVFFLAYTDKPPLWSYPSIEDYKNLPLGKTIEEYCAKPCSAFIFNDSIEMSMQTMLYTDTIYASRFPSFWFLPALENNDYRIDEKQRTALRENFRRLAAEDLARYKPGILILLEGVRFGSGPFDFVDYFSKDATFAAEMKNYVRKNDLTFNRRLYFGGTSLDTDRPVKYEVYQRRG